MSGRVWVVLEAALIVAVSFQPVYVKAQNGQSNAGSSSAQNSDIYRRAKVRVQPVYPDLARRMELSGTVKIEVVVAPNGTVKDARVVGGHPVLAGAALDAAKHWRFEPAPAESSGVIEFKFDPPHD